MATNAAKMKGNKGIAHVFRATVKGDIGLFLDPLQEQPPPQKVERSPHALEQGETLPGHGLAGGVEVGVGRGGNLRLARQDEVGIEDLRMFFKKLQDLVGTFIGGIHHHGVSLLRAVFPSADRWREGRSTVIQRD